VIEPSYIENIELATFAAKFRRRTWFDPKLIRGLHAFPPGAFALLCTDANFAAHSLL
jgi:hypothetical protein